MKKKYILRSILHVIVLVMMFMPLAVFAVDNDLVLPPSNVKLSTQNLLEGQRVRLYATVENIGNRDLLGFVRFLDSSRQIGSDQPISVVSSKDDTVFIDWEPTPGEHNISVAIIPFDTSKDNPANNNVIKVVTVLSDTDRDGIANSVDSDDDNDGILDIEDDFPLDKNEQKDSDGDSIGDNKDDDDDNDGIKDSDDGVPLDASEVVDTDKDGIGNNADPDDDNDGLNDLEEIAKTTDQLKPDTDSDGVHDKEDAFPTDPTQTRDTDRDGVSDEKDLDGDNDGIAKAQDVNDANQGPKIVITTENKPARRIFFPNETVLFESGKSSDPDGKIVSISWKIDEEMYSDSEIKTSFQTFGKKNITVKATDDKGESREKILTVLVVPKSLPWTIAGISATALALAIWWLLTYSKRRTQSKKGKKSR